MRPWAPPLRQAEPVLLRDLVTATLGRSTLHAPDLVGDGGVRGAPHHPRLPPGAAGLALLLRARRRPRRPRLRRSSRGGGSHRPALRAAAAEWTCRSWSCRVGARGHGSPGRRARGVPRRRARRGGRDRHQRQDHHHGAAGGGARRGGRSCGVIGTLTGARTTPEASELQHLLASMLLDGREAVAMEVSSHALDRHRVDATHFAVAVFTNLSQDHLDHHGTMDRYFAAKARLFRPDFCDLAVLNPDDPYGRLLAEQVRRDIPAWWATEGRSMQVERPPDLRPDGQHLPVAEHPASNVGCPVGSTSPTPWPWPWWPPSWGWTRRTSAPG